MIILENVNKSFDERMVLNNINFKVNTGEICFVLGKSGAGKSVLLRNIIGLIKPDSGKITVNGKDVTDMEEKQLPELRKKCGMIFQKPALLDSITIFENIAFPLRHHFRLTEEEIIRRVKRVSSLVHIGNNYFNKKPGDTPFSIKKRASIARTIILEPEILLFDEPTTGLDPVMTTIITDLIKDLSHRLKTTSIVVSHNINSAMSIADHILFIDKGYVIAEGSPEHMMKSENNLVKRFIEEEIF